ncbi:MAG: hypothetical protein J0M34_00535 [Alphaproteobacteria bacterium]|nr:hypothetical protein [Alphaproteobacteria bacterium]
MKFTKALLISTSIILLAACSVQSTDKGTKAETRSGGLFGLGTAADYDVQTEGAFKNVKQVVIGGFKVGFLEETKASNKASGGLMGGGFGGKSTAKVDLKGVDAALMQEITDAAYADFIAQLEKRGYTVADRGELLKNRDYANANKEKSPLREESSFLGADATITYVAPSNMEGLYFTGESGRSGGFGFGNPQVAAINFAEENKIPVVFVTYQVDFANKAGGHAGITTSAVEVGQGISVPPGGGVRIIGGQGGTFSSANGAILFGQPVSSSDTFGTIENTSTDAGVAVETAANIFSAVLGGGTNQTRSFEITAVPAKYKAVSLKVLGSANEKITAKMLSLR